MSEIRILEKEKHPVLLSEISDPPKKLYIKGELPSPEIKLLAIVGSRRFTPYGKEVCEKLIAGLSGYNIAIVSGLALGMDAIAHRAALQNNIPTIAVPGSGLHDKAIYPSSNRDLARDIVTSGGALLSEYEPNATPYLYMFPKRNRIMAGMSHATLIIEAGIKSGTLITARLAMEFNREVLTVPGSIYSTNSAGPHALIKDGATPVTDSTDILEALGIHENSTKEILQDLNQNEKQIVQALASPLSRDDLLDSLDLPIADINITLSTLEIKGVVKEHLGKIHLQ